MQCSVVRRVWCAAFDVVVLWCVGVWMSVVVHTVVETIGLNAGEGIGKGELLS